MAYNLTPNQQVILRAAAKGLRDGSVDIEWLYAATIGQKAVDLANFSEAASLNMNEEDLKTFTRLGFISSPIQRSNCVAYRVNKEAILRAVDTDFES